MKNLINKYMEKNIYKYNIIKKILPLLFLLIVFCNNSFSQEFKGLYFEKETSGETMIYVGAGSSIYVNGNILLTGGTNLSIHNLGDVYSTDSLINNSQNTFFEITVEGGSYHYIGEDTLFLMGNTINVYNLQSDSATVLVAENDAVIHNEFTVDKDLNLLGNIELRQRIFGGPRGKIIGEGNNKRIYNNPSDTGYIYSYDIYTSEVADRGLGLTINGNGATLDYIKREHHIKRRAADGSIRKSFHFDTNSGNTYIVDFKYFDRDFEGLGSNENDFRLWYSNNNVKFFKTASSSVNPAINEVTGTGLLLNSLNYQLTISDEICDNPPQINFPADTAYCEGSSMILSAENHNGNTSNGGFSFSWSRDATPLPYDTINITVNSPGAYTVCVTDTNGCFTYDDIIVNEMPKPAPNFSIIAGNSRCLNNSAMFNNTSTISDASELSYKWDFNDGSFSVEQEPEKLYSTEGLYQVSLIATSPFGCSDTITRDLRIHPMPVAGFENENSCSVDPITFTNSSTINPDVEGQKYFINQYTYIYGNGNDTTINSIENINEYVSHSYKFPLFGTYNVKLIAESTNTGCKDSITKVVQVYPKATADFNFNNVCESEKVSFTNNSTDNCTNFNWDFGNSNTSDIENPEFIFNGSGDFNVQLAVESSDGCTDTIDKQITVYPLPEVNFTVADTCQNSVVPFINTSSIASGNINTYSWNFDNGNSSVDESPSATYSTPGNFNIELVCTSDNSCVSSLSKEINVHPNPVAAFNAEEVCLGNETEFINNSYISDGTLDYSWDLGDSNSSVNSDPLHEYSGANDYTAILTATSQHGCTNIINKTITVNPLPELDLGGLIATCGSSVNVNALNPGSSYIWSNNASGQEITITQSGNYSVNVKNEHSCSIDEGFTVELDSEVQPNLGDDITVCDFAVLDSHYPDATSHIWNTGDDLRTLTVNSSGTYSVTVTDQNGCVGTDEINVTVNSSPDVSLGSDIVECDGTPIELNINNPNGEEILWSTDETTNNITVSNSGEYWVSLRNSNGCTAYDTIDVQILELPTDQFGEDITACGSVILDAGNPDCTYQWSDNSVERTLEVTSSGTYSVNITQNGCSITDAVNVTIDPVPTVELNDINICEGEITSLDAGNPGGSYSWSNGYTGQINQVGTAGIYEVEVTNSYGCSGNETVTVTTSPSPVFNIGSDATICNNEAIIYDPQVEADNYVWFNENGEISRRREIEIEEEGKYWMTASINSGCSWTDTVNVYRNPYSVVADFLVASDIYAGDTIQFIDISDPQPESYLWFFGDGIVDTIANPTHIYYQSGTFTVILETESGACSSSLAKEINVKLPDKNNNGSLTDISAEKPPKILDASLYPNPNDGNFTCEVELSEEYDIFIFIYNMKGSLVHDYKMPKQDYAFEYFSLQNLSPGMYVVKIVVENETRIIKFIKS